MVKHTQTVRRRFVDDLFECGWLFCGVGAEKVKPGDTCTNQPLSIAHQIYKSFDVGHEVRSVFLDMSRAFGKIYHIGLFFKLKQNGISSSFLSTPTDFLKLRKQRMVNSQLFSWSSIESGIPQWSILDDD